MQRLGTPTNERDSGMTYEASNARRVARPLTGLGLAVTAAVLDMELEAGVVPD